MSLSITGKYITVFQVEVKENYVQANISTGKKNKDGSYAFMSWKARFVGNAKEKAESLQDKDKIEITNGLIENTYDKEKKVLWVNVVVFNFDLMDNSTTAAQQQKPDLDDFEDIDSDENIPF